MLNTVAEIKRLCLFIASEEDDRINYDTKLANIQREFGKLDIKLVDVGDFFIYTNKKETHYIINNCNVRSLYAVRSMLNKALDQPVPKDLLDEMDYEEVEHPFQQWLNWIMINFPKATGKSSLIHLQREIKEVLEEIESDTPSPRHEDYIMTLMEYADCVLCIISSAGKEGFTWSEIERAVRNKIRINMKRKWKLNEDNTYSHIED